MCQFFLNMIKYWLSNIYSYLILDVKQASVRKEIFKVASKKERVLIYSFLQQMGIICFLFFFFVWNESQERLYDVREKTWGSRFGSTPDQLCRSWASQDPSLILHFHNKTKVWNYIIYLTGLLWRLNKVMYMKLA